MRKPKVEMKKERRLTLRFPEQMALAIEERAERNFRSFNMEVLFIINEFFTIERMGNQDEEE
jgi:hypothetical protein